MRNQLDNLEEAGMQFDQVVATNVYLDDLSDLPVFDEVYTQYFGSVPPARTTVQVFQQQLEQVQVVAVR